MKKKFINALIIGGVAVLGLSGLVGCQKEEEKPEPKPVTGFTIANKNALQEVWKLGEVDREMTFTFTGAEVNVASAISSGALTITSSDSEVVVVNGFMLAAKGVGKSTVTATYTNSEELGGEKFSDTVELEVKEQDKEKEAIKATVTEFANAEYDESVGNKEVYLVTGTITKFKGENGGDYGNVYISDGTTEILLYGTTATNTALKFADGKWGFKNPKDYLTNEFTKNLKVGDSVTALLIRQDYKGAAQGVGLYVYKGKGAYDDLVTPTKATLEEVINDSNVTPGVKLFETEATILGFGTDQDSLSDTPNNKYGNMFVTDGKNTIQVYGATAGKRMNWYKGKISIHNPQDFLTNEITKDLKKGDKIKFNCARSDYKGVKQIGITSLTKVE